MTTDDKYWANYDGLQHAKHAILKSYLNGWFPKLTSHFNNVLYIDCHAGKGKHSTGHEGSPLIALKCLLNHKSLNSIINKARVNFIFFERNEENYKTLMNEIRSYGKIPSNITIMPYHSDYESMLYSVCEALRQQGYNLAPCFAFLDPYGFDLSMELMNMLLSFPQSELCINFMYRYINMAIMLDSQKDNMDRLFGSSEWETVRSIEDPDIRERTILDIFSSHLDARFVTYMHMLSFTNTTKYLLIHATNHPSGRELMKQTMWNVSPDGSFMVSERNNPNQLILLKAEPDLVPLQESFLRKFRGQSPYMEDIYYWLQGEIYLPKHIHDILRKLDKESVIYFDNYMGRKAFYKNPRVNFY